MIREFLRALAILTASTVLGLAANALSGDPVSLSDPPRRIRAPRWTVDQLQEALEKSMPILLLDTRDEAARRRGRPKNALHVPYDRLVRDYARLGLDSLLRAADACILLCESDACPVADRCAEILERFGHSNVRVLAGGWKAYRAAGLPEEHP